MEITLRTYQQEALDAIKTAFREQPNVLLQAATGAGKTILFSALIRDYLTQYPGVVRIMIAAHRQTLVQQAVDKLLKVWPEGASQIGIACSSLSSRTDFSKPVVVGTIQTIARQLNKMELGRCNVLIIDEVHMVPPMAEKGKEPSQYEQVINRLRHFDPRARILGVTATPYRLNWGYIYGDVKTQDPSRNWFPDLTYSIDIATLREQGYLCELEKWGHSAPDLSHVSISKANGDYKENELSAEMSREVHLESAVNAVREYASDRKHIVVFAVTIEHAELLSERFRQSGYRSAFVHSKMPDGQVAATLAAFANGSVNVLVNVGKLTEGWDCPQTDCVVLCRPTKSAALYVQMVGRGLRIAEGKDKCLMLDLAGCLEEHGAPEDPVVKNKPPKKTEWIECPSCGKENEASAIECASCHWLLQSKTCKKCGSENRVDAVMCAYCHWPFPVEEEEEKPVYICPWCQAEVSQKAIICPSCGQEIKAAARDQVLQLVETPEPRKRRQPARIVEPPMVNFHFVSRRGNPMLQIRLNCLIGDDPTPMTVTDYLDIEGRNGQFWSLNNAKKKWRQLTGGKPMPQSLVQAESLQGELHFPEHITVELNNDRYWNVASY